MLRQLQPVVPDGCVDLAWLGGAGLVIAGADTGPRLAGPVGVAACGIRLRPGAAGAVLGMPASEFRDQQVPVSLVWGDGGARIGEAMAQASAAERLALLSEAVLRRRGARDPLVGAAARRLATRDSRVSDVAADLGVSERQLHRRMLASVGYGPKMLARVARLRRLICLPDDSLATRALSAGYASQAHMNEEVRRLTGTTPVRFLKDATLTAA
ncbi:MAG: helix-turn-helix domain-containing protein [Streptosporangiaceae bacterium]|nr:helix-turn-helix domain-containing protein [Streptosporangiaceae bacterium]